MRDPFKGVRGLANNQLTRLKAMAAWFIKVVRYLCPEHPQLEVEDNQSQKRGLRRNLMRS